MSRYAVAAAFCIIVPLMALAQVPSQGVIGGSVAAGGSSGAPAICSTGTVGNIMAIGAGPACSQTTNLTVSGATTTWTGTLRTAGTAGTDSIFLYGLSPIYWFDTTSNQNGAYSNLDASNHWRLVRRSSGADSTALFLKTSNGHFSVGTNTAATSMFNVGNGDEFQVSSAGALAKVRNATPTGVCTLNGGSPSTCTATVASGATCLCSVVGTTSQAAGHGCAVSLSGTTLTVTSDNSQTHQVNWICL